MTSQEKIIYEYSVLRYVPDIERSEYINIGLIMMCKRHKWLHSNINIDVNRINALFPKADIDTLTSQSLMFLREDVPFPNLPVEERYRWLIATKSAIIQTSPSHPGIIISTNNNIQTSSSTTPISPTNSVTILLNNKFSQLFKILIL